MASFYMEMIEINEEETFVIKNNGFIIFDENNMPFGYSTGGVFRPDCQVEIGYDNQLYSFNFYHDGSPICADLITKK